MDVIFSLGAIIGTVLMVSSLLICMGYGGFYFIKKKKNKRDI